jgi:hypothetical protein
LRIRWTLIRGIANPQQVRSATATAIAAWRERFCWEMLLFLQISRYIRTKCSLGELIAEAYASGWTVREIAAHKDVGPSQISQLLIFGRFIKLSPTGDNFIGLTERAFRELWRRTEEQWGERSRLLIFGRFVKLSPTGNNFMKVTEGSFRDPWSATGSQHESPNSETLISADKAADRACGPGFGLRLSVADKSLMRNT